MASKKNDSNVGNSFKTLKSDLQKIVKESVIVGIGLKLIELLLRQKLFGTGLKGKPNTPLIVSYAVTRACNLRCLHCHVAARDAMANELNLQEAMQAVDEMALLGTEALIFSGGEPMLRKDFILALAEYCVDAGIIPAMLTNGVLINHKVALELKEAGIMAVGIPLDSVIPESHDKLRNLPGTFEKAVKAVEACLDVDLEVVITTMALKDTFNDLPKRIDFIANLGVDQVAVYDLVPVGRGKDVMDQAMNQTQREHLIMYLQQMQEDSEMVFTMSGGLPLYPEIASEIHKLNGTTPKDLLLKQFWINAPVGCHAGILYFSLRPNGDIYPCTFLPVKIGNIREQSLADIWCNSKVLNELRKRSLLKGKCGECKYRETCGGCRGRAYACTGDYLETDPVCLEDLLLRARVLPSEIKRFGWCVG
ncbi:radical SAM protein [Candidatus Bathyarchaeota archaeon]|nr:radical SAM protein [Candidatus Bathyarchaeota archaeon]